MRRLPPTLPSPSVWAGEIGDRRSGTWVTPFRMPSKPSNHRILLLRLRRWGCGHRACDVHKSTGGDVASQVEGADRLRAVMQTEHGVGSGRAQRDGLAAEGFADAPEPVFETDEAGAIDLADGIAGTVFDRRELLRKAARTEMVARAGGLEPQRLVRPLVIVDRPPCVEGALAGSEIAKAVPVQDLGLQRAMEALVLALRLRMVRPAMRDADPQPHQPRREHGEGLSPGIAPRRAVVHQHRERQAVAAEQPDQARANGGVLLIAAGFQPHRIARVIVKHGERMTASPDHREMALEIHLPQLVRGAPLEAPERARMLAFVPLELVMPAQNLGDRARRRYRSIAIARHHLGDLAATPGVVAARSDAKNRRFHRVGAAARTAHRAARTIGKPGPPLRRVPLQPFVALVPADAEAPAQLAPVRPHHQGQSHKLLPLVHDRQLPPRHRVIPHTTKLGRTSVTHVTERLSPMSPVHTEGAG